VSYIVEITAGLIAGALIAGFVYFEQERTQDLANRDAAVTQVQVLQRFSKSAARKGATLPSQNDPWGRPYSITGSAEAQRVCSLGADGRVGTADDICTP